MRILVMLLAASLAGSIAMSQEMPRAMPADAADLEKKLTADPEDLPARQELIGIYTKRMSMPMMSSQAEGRRGYLVHLQWLVEHHPEAALAALPGMGLLRPDEADRVLGWWQGVLGKRGSEAEVVFTAGNFFGARDVRKGIALLRQSGKLGAARAAQALGTTYFGVLLAASRPDDAARMHLIADPALAAEVQAELEQSAEPAVYGTTGGWLVCFNRPAPRDEYVALGRTLVTRARAAEPTNPRWAQAFKCMEK